MVSIRRRDAADVAVNKKRMKGLVFKVLCTATPMSCYCLDFAKYPQLLGVKVRAKTAELASFFGSCWRRCFHPR